MFEYLAALIKREPAIIVGAVVGAVIWAAQALDIVVDRDEVELVVAPIVTGILARFFVVPANEVEEVAVDEKTHRRTYR